MSALGDVMTRIERDVPIPTWFGVGGNAHRLAKPADAGAAASLVRSSADRGERVRALGDGANLLVDDRGVGGLVLDLAGLDGVRTVGGDLAEDGQVVLMCAGAGVRLGALIGRCVREGLAGIETLAGIPASVGGAVVMNAGGKFGQIADVVRAVRGVRVDGSVFEFVGEEVGFGYRCSGLTGCIVTEVDLGLRRVVGEGHDELRARHREVLAYKRSSQPMGERSAGCAFKNPLIDGERVSAGMLIDRAGGKGLREGGAWVSERHANFITVERGAKASDVIGLMRTVRERVAASRGVVLEAEVVIWSDEGDPLGEVEG